MAKYEVISLHACFSDRYSKCWVYSFVDLRFASAEVTFSVVEATMAAVCLSWMFG